MNALPSDGSPFLIAAAALSALAALLHIGVIIGGPEWYRFFGAGEGMARLAEQGSFVPATITLLIASMLAIWSAYALSGAGVLPDLPFIRTALALITAVYIGRGLVGFFLAPSGFGGNSTTFWLWSSAICLLIGAVHAIALYRAWPVLSRGF